jgi:hypothetical protein
VMVCHFHLDSPFGMRRTVQTVINNVRDK